MLFSITTKLNVTTVSTVSSKTIADTLEETMAFKASSGKSPITNTSRRITHICYTYWWIHTVAVLDKHWSINRPPVSNCLPASLSASVSWVLSINREPLQDTVPTWKQQSFKNLLMWYFKSNSCPIVASRHSVQATSNKQAKADSLRIRQEDCS